jgi:hypothetical protein
MPAIIAQTAPWFANDPSQSCDCLVTGGRGEGEFRFVRGRICSCSVQYVEAVKCTVLQSTRGRVTMTAWNRKCIADKPIVTKHAFLLIGRDQR